MATTGCGECCGEMENGRRFIIDRFEGDYAVCERLVDRFESDCVACERLRASSTDAVSAAGNTVQRIGNVNIPKRYIDIRAREGAVIACDSAGRRYIYDEEATARRTARISDLMKKLWR